MQSPPFPRYPVPPRSKYSPQHQVLKHPQLNFLPQCQRPSFTPIQNNRQNYSLSTDITVMNVPCILYTLLPRPTNAQHNTTHNILYIVSTPPCFLAPTSSSASLNLLLC